MDIPLDLTDDERRELIAFLDERVAPNGGMSIEYVDGFFAGLAAMWLKIQPDEWLPYVFGDDDWEEAEPSPFDDSRHGDQMLRLLLGHWNSVVCAIQQRGDYRPITRKSPLKEEGPEGQAWARSFFVVTEMAGSRAWKRFAKQPEAAIVVAPILALAFGEGENSKGKVTRLSAKQRAMSLSTLPMIVQTIAVALAPKPKGRKRAGDAPARTKAKPKAES